MQTTDSAQVASAIDSAVSGPVLVVGSLPPSGRDLDLLAAPDQYDAVINWLTGAGFVRWRNTWVAFEGAAAYAVDLSSTRRWATDHSGPAALFQNAETIPGFRHLMRPSPTAVLLLAARGMVSRRGMVTDKVRGRVAAAIERDPGVWSTAEQLGGPLGMSGALRLLRAACSSPHQLSLSGRAAGVAGVFMDPGPWVAKTRLLADIRPRQWRPAVVSFSGLDGSGKSTQVSMLSESLKGLGIAAQPQWAGFKTGASLRRLLPFLERSPRRLGSRPNGQQPERDPLVPAVCLEHRLRQHVWLSTVVAFNVISLWRFVLQPRRGIKVVVFDRFSPDTAVKFELHFAHTREIDIRFERALFLALSPKPDIGFLVRVSSQEAHRRRQDQTPEELAVMARAYDEQVTRFSLKGLDGTQPAQHLSEQVTPAAWEAMR